MKKKIICIFCLLTAFVFSASVVQAQDYTYTTNGDGTCTITGYTGSGGAVTIPSTINGLPVTSIEDWAFGYCTTLTSVTIPDSVTSIGDYAFGWCYSLTSVTIGNSVTSIGDWAFSDCTSLTSVTIGNNVISIGDYAFGDCNNLTSVTIGNNVISIGDYAFGWCYSLTSVTIGNSVTSIGDDAFGWCTSLTSVTIGNSVTSIGDWAFAGCNNLTSVTIGNSVTSIGDEAFVECNNLTSVTIPDSVTSIGDWAFLGCSSLTSVTIGNSVTSIGESAFEYCWSLTSVTIPDSVTSIGDSAFLGCSSLTSVTIGNSVTSIGESAFEYCWSLTCVYFQGNAPSADSSVFNGDNNATVYYLAGTTGWDTTFGGVPTALSLSPGCQWCVKPMLQGDSRWGDWPYGYVLPSSSCGPVGYETIRCKGCALTSLAMALNFELNRCGVSYQYTPDDLDVTLLAFGGYDINSAVMFPTAVSSAAFDVGRPKLCFKSFETSDPAALQSVLCGNNSHPVIVRVKPRNKNCESGCCKTKWCHYVLVTGMRGTNFKIVDPGHADVNYLDAYKTFRDCHGNYFRTRGIIVDPDDVSGMDIAASDAVELLIIDPLGRRTGFDQGTEQDIEEIPQSAYTREGYDSADSDVESMTESHMADIFQPVAGNYRMILIGQKEGTYTLQVNAFERDGRRQPPIILTGSIQLGMTNSFDIPFDPGSDVRFYAVDLNHDGIVNFSDFAIFAFYWMDGTCSEPDWCEGRDFNHDGVVDVKDLQIFAEFWLWPVADVDMNGAVNFTDYAIFADNWFETDCEESNNWCEGTDFDHSGSVDIFDLATFARYWLEGL
jgi:hypothetical protein